MNEQIREYMKQIGAKGGMKRKSHPRRIEMARKAARTRWKDHKKKQSHTLPACEAAV